MIGVTVPSDARLKEKLDLFDASDLAKVTMGDSIFSNMMVFGGAWQRGLIPLSHDSIVQAIELNGATVERNLRAFEIGRWAVLHPEDAAAILRPRGVARLPQSREDRIAYRADHLAAYQGKRLAKRYRKLVDAVKDPDLQEAVAKGYHKVLAYKDEYEVARLLLDSRDKAAAEFDGEFRMTFHLAPPILGGKGPDGRPRKREFGEWMLRPMRLLARMKALRGTPFDPFGYFPERRMERALIRQYETDMKEILPKVAPENRDIALALAALPLDIRGFGPVKRANARKAAKRREQLLESFRRGGPEMRKAAE